MALWQYTFIIIPTVEPAELMSVIDKEPDGTQMINDDKLWEVRAVATRNFDSLKNILPEGRSWRSNLRVYGELDSNCIQVTSDNDFVDYMSVRIDFRTEYENILAKIISFTEENHLLILDEHLNILPNSADEIRKVIEVSPQVAKWRSFSRDSH